MHALSLATAPRAAAVRGPSRAAPVVLVPLVLVAVAVLAPVLQPDLAAPGSDGPASAVWVVNVPAQSPCGPSRAELPAAAALGALLDCQGSLLAARARALEFDPVR